jgi:hypothetical protein
MTHSSVKQTGRDFEAVAKSPSRKSRPSVFVVVTRPSPSLEKVAVPSEDYAVYLRSHSDPRKLTSIRSRWLTMLSERVSFRYDGDYCLLLDKLPEGWMMMRYLTDDVCAPSYTLSTILDDIPVVFPSLELAGLVAESASLARLANLFWRRDAHSIGPVFEAHMSSLGL